MIYARLSAQISEDDRRQLLNAINQNDASVLESFTDQSRIVHVYKLQDLHDPTLYCLWCHDRVFPTRQNGPRRRKLTKDWYFKHASNNECIGNASVIISNAINPALHGCYAAMGCEKLPGRNRRNCRCITLGTSYCHLALAAEPPCL